MNVQYAVKDDAVYVLEVNPRASRTVPFVSKAIGVPLAKLAALVMAGKSLEELGFTREIRPRHFSVKEAVFPFVKFPGVDTLLGPEMKSTGEVMGIDSDFGRAYAKAQIEAGNTLPTTRHGAGLGAARGPRARSASRVRELARNGFHVLATDGTAAHLESLGVARRDRRRRWATARRTSWTASRRATCTSSSTRSAPSRRPRRTRSRCAARR